MALSRAKSRQSQPKRKAIDHRVSPRRTTYWPLVTRSRLLRSTTCTPPDGELAHPTSNIPARMAASAQWTDEVRIHCMLAVNFNARSL